MSIDYRILDYLCFSSILHVLSLLTDIFLSPSIVALKINEIHLFTCSVSLAWFLFAESFLSLLFAESSFPFPSRGSSAL